MGIKISALPNASTLTGIEEVPIVQSGTTKKTAASNLMSPVYPANEIVFGDGSTAGGITNASCKLIPSIGAGADIEIAASDGGANGVHFYTASVSALVGLQGVGAGGDINLVLNGSGGLFTMSDSPSNAGIYFAGINSIGLGSVTGLGIDILNDVYKLGNSATSSIYLDGGIGGSSITTNSDITIASVTGFVSLTTSALTLTLDQPNNKFLFSGLSNVLNIGGKDIDYSAANAAGFWRNDGAGVISYVNGASGSFTAQSGEVVTVVDGLITSIV